MRSLSSASMLLWYSRVPIPPKCMAVRPSPADAARATEYGEVGEIPGAMFDQFMTLFESPDAPKPHDIAEAIARLIDAPKGQRPTRTVVGTSFGADTLNDATAPVQAGTVKALGLDHLETVTAA